MNTLILVKGDDHIWGKSAFQESPSCRQSRQLPTCQSVREFYSFPALPPQIVAQVK